MLVMSAFFLATQTKISNSISLFRLTKKMSKARQLIVNKHAANEGLSTAEAEAKFIEVSASSTLPACKSGCFMLFVTQTHC